MGRDLDNNDMPGKAIDIHADTSDQLGTQFGLVIGKALKAHFDELTEAPVPSKFLDLLAQLESSTGKKA